VACAGKIQQELRTGAALAYNKFALEAFGEYAVLNAIEDD
jgi:hypothetical protein